MVDKLERQDATKGVEEQALETLSGDPEADLEAYKERRAAVPARLRQAREGHHPPADRRRQEAAGRPRREEIRDIWIEVGVAPRTHGSAIFTAARRRRSRSPRSAPPVRRCGSTRSGC